MSNSIFRDEVKEGHDNDQEQLELGKLCKDDEEFVVEDDGKDRELVNVDDTSADDFLEEKKNSIFRDEVKEVHDNDQEQLELGKLCKDDEEFVVEDDGKDKELVNANITGDGFCCTEDDNNDGFRTPTSIEHRIPVPTQCPPAPKKICKRKFEGSSIAEIIRSATKIIHDQFMVFKKARRDDDALS